MTPQRWQEIDRIFSKALEREPGERAEFLDDACGDDMELRRHVESLLMHDTPESLIGSSAVEEATQLLTKVGEDSLIGRTIGRWKLVRSIGSGAMGQVYLGHDTRLNRPVAVKLLSFYAAAADERIRRFRQEALTASALNHPNILTIHEIGEFEHHNFIVTEFVEGQTLQQRIQLGKIPLEQGIDLAIQIAGALSAAHAAGIVHRDIKPANIMLRPDGLVKILDFGIAKYVPGSSHKEQQTALETTPGVVVGTAAYMSPEQARGLPLDVRTDIWSLGVILFEMISGRRPFQGDTALDLMSAVVQQEAPRLADVGVTVPEALERIVSHALTKDLDGRHQNVNEMLSELKDLKRLLESGMPLDSLKSGERSKSKGGPPAIAVMPFVNMSSDKDNDYFCEGLAEELSNALMKIENLRVAARTSTFSFKGKEATVSAIGRALNVGSVLEGSVRKSGDRLRITVQLINAGDGYQLWSERYDRQMKDIFDIQDEIALSVVDALKVTLIGNEKSAVLKRYTDSVEAYELYLKGRYYWWKTNPEEFVKGKEYFERAFEVDPNYALSYAGLASYYGFGSAFGMLPPDMGWPKAIAANTRGLELDDTLAELHVNEGGINMVFRRDFAAAEKNIERALELNPRFQEAHFIQSFFLLMRGRFDQAIAEARRAVELDPFSPRLLNHLGLSYYIARRFAEAINAFTQAVEFDPKNPLLHDVLGDAQLCAGLPAEAVNSWKTGLECVGAAEAAQLLSETFAKDGIERTLPLFAQMKLQNLKARRERGDYVPEIHFVRALVAVGDVEAAVARFAKACEERNVFPLLVHADPFYDNLRADQRVTDVLERSNLTP